MAEIGIIEVDVEDYETLPTHSLHIHLLAGALAGITEHCVMFPIDSVKTRAQSLCPCPERACRTPVQGLMSIIREEGIWRPMRGMNVIATGAIPAHALYFCVYEKLKLFLTNRQPGYHPLKHGIAGAAATLCHDAIMNPAEVVKQRMQMYQSPYQGCFQCARCVFRTEGLCAFYRSYTTQLILNVPFQSTHFIFYELGQQIMNPRRRYDPLTHLSAGGLAGGVAAAVTTPLDVIKTVLNTQQSAEKIFTTANTSSRASCPASFPGILDAARSVFKARGFVGFFSGLQARVLFQVPSTAVSWSVYEFFKFVLSYKDKEDSVKNNKTMEKLIYGNSVDELQRPNI